MVSDDFEKSARDACQKRGIDPNKEVDGIPAWRVIKTAMEKNINEKFDALIQRETRDMRGPY